MTQLDSGPNFMKGTLGVKLYLDGIILYFMAFLFIVPIAFESKMGRYEDIYGISLLSMAILFVCIGYGLQMWGNKKQKLEIKHGYTTSVPEAAKNPNLYLIGYKTREVIWKPGERPEPEKS